jgi:hypothetical protein
MSMQPSNWGWRLSGADNLHEALYIVHVEEPEDRWWFTHLPAHFAPGRMINVLPDFTIMPILSAADDTAYREAADVVKGRRA